LPLLESSLQRLGEDLPEGVIAGARGDHYFLHPEYKDDPEFQAFMERFKEKTGAYPIYPVFHMAQALEALKAAYQKAIETGGGEWPDTEALVDAMEGLEFRGLSRPIEIREDHQGLEDQMLGTTIQSDDYGFAVLDNMMIFPADKITTPVGQISEEWVRTLPPDMVDMQVDTYRHGS
jgi:branched-chain amino acid transport system substrate-binding protein